jgi:hypothetical protein
MCVLGRLWPALAPDARPPPRCGRERISPAGPLTTAQPCAATDHLTRRHPRGGPKRWSGMERTRLLRLAASALVAALTVVVVPRHLCGGMPQAFFDDDTDDPVALARGVAHHLEAGPTPADFSTGAALFDAEWAFGSHVMGVLGLAQVIRQRPQTRDALLPALRIGSRRLLDPALRKFGTEAWGDDGLSAQSEGDHAYLGYAALALSVARTVDPAPSWTDDALLARLTERVLASPTGMIETYPGEAYPVDVSSIVGAAAVLARHQKRPTPPVVAHYVGELRRRYLDEHGYLVQAVDARDGQPFSRGRASGTALAAYFVGFADAPLQADLYRALDAHTGTFFGFHGVHEYADGRDGRGDVDSGPVPLGISVSGTGFMIASARAQGDRDRFVGLARTAMLFGMPSQQAGRLRFASGGPLGDAILLAMLTAERPSAREAS